ncbi:hypothetical protein [Rhodoferax sp.]
MALPHFMILLLGCFVIGVMFRGYQEFLSRRSEARALEPATLERSSEAETQ